MIDTYSKFYYGFEITTENKFLDFDEGTGELSAEITTGNYTLEDLAQAVEDALNETGTFGYTVSVNRTTRIITIASSGSTDFLASTGSSVTLGVGIFSTLGYPATDVMNTMSYVASTAIGTVYTPQYKLQDYVSPDDLQMQRNGTVSKSASGKVQLQSFGVDRMIEFSIKFATNIYQPSSGPIVNSSSGVANLQSFLQHCMNKYYIEFMPDKDTPSTYYRLVLDSAPGGSDGMGYRLQEQYARGLKGYFESGILTFRIIED